jgi:hypothetical protein
VSINAPRAVKNSLSTESDPNGRFEFVIQDPGDIRLTAAAPGYVSPGDPITRENTLDVKVAAGKRVFTVDLSLVRTNSVGGFLIDADSRKPVSGMRVAAARRGFRAGEAYFSNPATSSYSSGADGRFLIKDLPPGDYVLALMPHENLSIEPLPADRDAELSAAPQPSSGYVRLYWPGFEQSPQWWNAFWVRAGAVVDLGKLPVPRRSLYTLVVSAQDFACGADDTFEVVVVAPPWATLADKRVPCRSFRVSNVPEGAYRIEVIHASSSGGPLEHASEAVELVRNARIQLTVQRPVRVSGVVSVEGAVQDELPDNLTRCLVFLSPLSKLPFATEAPARLGPMGAFEVSAFPTHTYSISLMGFPSESYYVKQVTYNGTILPDPERVTLADAVSAHSLRIMLSGRPAGIAAKIDFGMSKPPGDFTVVLVRKDLDSTRRLVGRVSLSADGEGRVTKSGLPPFSYYVLALPTDSLPALERPGVLDGLLLGAASATLNENQITSIVVPLLSVPSPDE